MSPVQALEMMHEDYGYMAGVMPIEAMTQEGINKGRGRFIDCGRIVAAALVDGLPKWGHVCELYAIAHKFVAAYGSKHHQKELKAAADRLGITFLEPDVPHAETPGNTPPPPKDMPKTDRFRIG